MYRPGLSGSIHISFTRFGMRSVLPASRGIQKLWATSAESSLTNVGVALSGLLTGTCSSFAVTIPSDGYRNSHHHWWPIAVTWSAPDGLGAFWIASIVRAPVSASTTTMSTGITVHASSTCVLP